MRTTPRGPVVDVQAAWFVTLGHAERLGAAPVVGINHHSGKIEHVTAPLDGLQIDRHAGNRTIGLPPTSWVELVPGFVRDAEAAFTELHESVSGSRLRCCATTATCPSDASVRACAATHIRCCTRPGCTCRSRFRVPFTGVAAILYRNGEDFQGLHSDREMRWLDETVIAIIVLGAAAAVRLAPRAAGGVPVERVPAGSDPNDVVLTPGEGDMLIMGGACQREWLHGVPQASTDRPADLADVAMDEPAWPPRHQPDLLRRPPVQRRHPPPGSRSRPT